jgi:hypothetical protein
LISLFKLGEQDFFGGWWEKVACGLIVFIKVLIQFYVDFCRGTGEKCNQHFN